MKKVTGVLLALILALSIAPASIFAESEDLVRLTIIHVNDRHGRTAADAYVSQMAKDLEGENVLILDAGDTFHGQTTTNLSKGESMADVMNAVGYNAMVPGNHDFNFGLERLLMIRDMLEFPMLAANVKISGASLFEAYQIFEMEGLRVGVFGLATPETTTKSDPRIVAGITFEDPATVAGAVVDELKAEGCDVIIALTHLGVDNESERQNTSYAVAEIPGIDLIVDGHSHTELPEGEDVGGTLLVQTGSFAANIGVVTLEISEDSVRKSAMLVPVPEEGEGNPDLNILEAIAAADAKNEPITSVVVGNTPVLLQGEREYVRTQETNLANLVTDSMRYATGAEVAFLTGGNIRASISPGDITMGEALTTLPFSNLLATVELKGEDLLKVLEHGVSKYPEAAGQNIQVSGLSFEFDPEAEPMNRVGKVVMQDGSELDINKSYTVATIDFIIAGGDGYEMMKNATGMVYYQGDVEAFAEYLSTNPQISSEPEGRVTVKKAEQPQLLDPPQIAEQPQPMEQPVELPQFSEPTVILPVMNPDVYIVKPGDNLTKIARLYNTTWRELQRLNSIENANLIYPGQVIILPAQ